MLLQAQSPTPAAAISRPAATPITRMPAPCRSTKGVGPVTRPARVSSNSSRASPISCSRLRGSLVRHRRSRYFTFSGVLAGRAPHSGSRSMMPTRISVAVRPGNVRFPLSTSYITQPKAQISVFRSTGLPEACSGLMYGTVPITTPASVISGIIVAVSASAERGRAASIALASPKSSTFTLPSAVILRLAGFKSRWTTPASCAAPSASATCRPRSSASLSGSGALARRCESVSPGTYSSTRNFTPPASSRP